MKKGIVFDTSKKIFPIITMAIGIILALALQNDTASILKIACNLMLKAPTINMDDSAEDLTELDKEIIEQFLESYGVKNDKN